MVLLMLVVAVWRLARSLWFSFTDININDISDHTLYTLYRASSSSPVFCVNFCAIAQST